MVMMNILFGQEKNRTKTPFIYYLSFQSKLNI